MYTVMRNKVRILIVAFVLTVSLLGQTAGSMTQVTGLDPHFSNYAGNVPRPVCPPPPYDCW